MSNRKCNLFADITNEGGTTKRYFLTPISLQELGPDFVAGYRVVNRSEEPSPVYFVRLSPGAIVSCTCPDFCRRSECKHEAALTAAGVLPVRFIEMLWEHSKLLDRSEQSLKNRDLEREAACRNADSLRATIGELEQRCHQLQTALAAKVATPSRRRRQTAKAA
jgi:hypothetical protein